MEFDWTPLKHDPLFIQPFPLICMISTFLSPHLLSILIFFNISHRHPMIQAYDDDWDSDFDDQPSQQMPPPPAPGMLSVPGKNSGMSGSSGDLSSMGKRTGGAAATAAAGRTRFVKKTYAWLSPCLSFFCSSFNRFSTFVKSGGENFILGKLNANVQENDLIQVVVRIDWPTSLRWSMMFEHVTCRTTAMGLSAGSILIHLTIAPLRRQRRSPSCMD